MLRRKLLIINLVFAFVLLSLTVGGVFGLLASIDKADRRSVDIGQANEVCEVLDTLRQSDLPNASALETRFPEGWRLLWVDSYGNVLANTGLDSRVVKAVQKRASNLPAKDSVTVYYGIAIVSRTYGQTTLHVVDATDNHLQQVARNLWLFVSVFLVSLLIIFVGSIVVEIQAIFPRLKRLQSAMDKVYNGNYDQTIRVPGGKRRDEITALLVDFDMLRRKLRDATLAKEAADRERGIVVSGISHDLRTPLTVIKTHAKGLLDGVAKRVGKEQEYISAIYGTALEMENLVAKLADFTKVESHEITYSFMVRDICELIQNFVEKYRIAYAARGLNLACKLPKGKKLWVNIDKDQFNRVWQNLCDNSLKYKDKEEAHVLITAELVENNVVVKVADDGPGIAEYEVEYIFESYYRGDASRTNPTDGSGLGLSIVKNCVNAHNGHVQAYNNHGLTIEIILPYRRKK